MKTDKRKIKLKVERTFDGETYERGTIKQASEWEEIIFPLDVDTALELYPGIFTEIKD
jgi:hypothetical protein